MTDIRSEETVDQLRNRLALRERQLDTVHRISAALSSVIDMDTLLKETLDISLQTVDADAGSLLIYNRDTRKLVFVYVVGKEELIGQEIDPEQSPHGKAATAFLTGQPLLTPDTRTEDYDRRFDTATGYITHSMITVPLKNINGEPIGVLQALNKRHESFGADDLDLLEIVSSLAATTIVNARLAEEAQLAAVARAVGDLGHDIKNALTPIETMVETTVALFIAPMFARLDELAARLAVLEGGYEETLLSATQQLRAWYPEAQSSVRDGCADIREMVSEIADYIKGTQATNIEMNCLSEVMEERLRRLRALAVARHMTLQILDVEDIPSFMFDRRLVGRAIFNLVNNAFGAISDAVKRKVLELRPFTITVQATAVVEGCFPDGNYCLIEVIDDGPGIPDYVKRTLFTPHVISTTQGGTGIGTRFIKGVADAHRGLVGVKSELGHGAHFWMKLPLV